MKDINQFQCPGCGARLTYNGEKGQMTCQYCDSVFSMEEIMAEEQEKEEMAAGSQMEWQTSSSSVISGLDGKIEGYSCPACGAQMVADENTAATECPYCGNFSIIKTSFDGMYKPDLVVPFAVSKEKAQAALGEFTKGKKLLPDTFLQRNRIDSITGLYVPFWLYSCHAEGKICYEGVKSKKWEDDKYEYVKKDHYRIIRSGGMDFERIPVDASTKMDDAIMDSLEPYDLSAAKPYDAAYFSGYLADRYDVQEAAARPRANQRVENTFRDRLREEVRDYEDVMATSEQINLSDAKAEYGMLPVWMMTTQYEGKPYVFGINGQTGQLVGSLPIDKNKVVKHFGIAFVIALVVAQIVIAVLLNAEFNIQKELISAAISALVAFIRVSSLKAAMNTVHIKTTARAYMKQNTVKLGRSVDRMLYSRTEKKEKPPKQQ